VIQLTRSQKRYLQNARDGQRVQRKGRRGYADPAIGSFHLEKQGSVDLNTKQAKLMTDNERAGMPFTYVQGERRYFMPKRLVQRRRISPDARHERPRRSLPVHHAESAGGVRVFFHVHRVALPFICSTDVDRCSSGSEGETAGRQQRRKLMIAP